MNRESFALTKEQVCGVAIRFVQEMVHTKGRWVLEELYGPLEEGAEIEIVLDDVLERIGVDIRLLRTNPPEGIYKVATALQRHTN